MLEIFLEALTGLCELADTINDVAGTPKKRPEYYDFTSWGEYYDWTVKNRSKAYVEAEEKIRQCKDPKKKAIMEYRFEFGCFDFSDLED